MKKKKTDGYIRIRFRSTISSILMMILTGATGNILYTSGIKIEDIFYVTIFYFCLAFAFMYLSVAIFPKMFQRIRNIANSISLLFMYILVPCYTIYLICNKHWFYAMILIGMILMFFFKNKKSS